MVVQEYSLKFTRLAKYAPHVVAYSGVKISKFVSRVFSSVVKVCRTTMLIKEIDLSRLMIYAHQIKKVNNKEKERENKR